MNEAQKEAQDSNVCKICGGIKSLFFEIKPMSDDAPITSHPVRYFKLCSGHHPGQAMKKEDADESTK